LPKRWTVVDETVEVADVEFFAGSKTLECGRLE